MCTEGASLLVQELQHSFDMTHCTARSESACFAPMHGNTRLYGESHLAGTACAVGGGYESHPRARQHCITIA